MNASVAIRAAALAGVLGLLPAAAQQAPERWRLNGSLGFRYSQTNQNNLFTATPGADSEYGTTAGDFRLNLNAFLYDPAFLPFSVSVSGTHGAETVAQDDYRNNRFNWNITTAFLPASSTPIRFYYYKNSYSANGSVFDQDSEASSLGLEWALRRADLPELRLGYSRFSSNVHLPNSITDNDYRQGRWYVGARDTWKGWEWDVAFDDYSYRSNFGAGLGLATDFRDDMRLLFSQVRRRFWAGKADLRIDNRSQWRRNELSGQNPSRTRESYTTANLALQHTPKLTSSFAYGLVRIQSRGDGVSAAPPGAGLILVQAPSVTSHSATGRVDYRATRNLTFFEEVRYYRVTPPQTNLEVQQSLTESLSGVNYTAAWRGLDLSASYAGRVQLMGTNLGARNSTFSNDLDLRAGWGSRRHVRLVGSLHYSKLNLVEQIGGFSEDRRFRLEAETDRLRPFRIQVHAERARVALLNLSGRTELVTTNFGVQAGTRSFTLGYTRSLGDGAGAVFTTPIRLRPRITVPLPVNDLIDTPLLSRNSAADSAFFAYRPTNQLEFRGQWRSEANLFSTSDQNFFTLELRARYQLAKFTFEGVWGRYSSEILSGGAVSGLRVNRFFLRVVRDFTVF